MRNEMTLNALVGELQRNCGDILAAAKAVGVSLMFVSTWRKDDKKVDEILIEAERVGYQGLVSAAIQRAVYGVPKGVYYKGARVGEEPDYSDGLLQTLLKAKVPEFAKDAEGAGVQVNVNVANIMPRAANYQEWLAMKDQTINRALPAPDPDRDASLEALSRVMCEPPNDVIDAEYVEVPFRGIDL
jgi:hypothetical protein